MIIFYGPDPDLNVPTTQKTTYFVVVFPYTIRGVMQQKIDSFLQARDAERFVRVWLKDGDMLFTGTIRDINII